MADDLHNKFTTLRQQLAELKEKQLKLANQLKEIVERVTTQLAEKNELHVYTNKIKTIKNDIFQVINLTDLSPHDKVNKIKMTLLTDTVNTNDNFICEEFKKVVTYLFTKEFEEFTTSQNITDEDTKSAVKGQVDELINK